MCVTLATMKRELRGVAGVQNLQGANKAAARCQDWIAKKGEAACQVAQLEVGSQGGGSIVKNG